MPAARHSSALSENEFAVICKESREFKGYTISGHNLGSEEYNLE